MIDFKNQTIKVPNHPVENIARWVVWFVTIEGTFDKWSDAVASCDKVGQPIELITPVPVALGVTTYEVCLRQPFQVTEEEGENLHTPASNSGGG